MKLEKSGMNTIGKDDKQIFFYLAATLL